VTADTGAEKKADINLIEFENLKVCAPETVYDLATGRRFVQCAEGCKYAIVNGEVVFCDGEPIGAMLGKSYPRRSAGLKRTCQHLTIWVSFIERACFFSLPFRVGLKRPHARPAIDDFHDEDGSPDRLPFAGVSDYDLRMDYIVRGFRFCSRNANICRHLAHCQGGPDANANTSSRDRPRR